MFFVTNLIKFISHCSLPVLILHLKKLNFTIYRAIYLLNTRQLQQEYKLRGINCHLPTGNQLLNALFEIYN